MLLNRFTKALNKMTLRADRVAKVVPDRIFSLAVHPTEDKTLVMAGDKWGKLGFWDVVGILFMTFFKSHCHPSESPI